MSDQASDRKGERWEAPAIDGSDGRGFLTAANLQEVQQQAYDEAWAEGHAKGVESGEAEVRRRIERFDQLLGALHAPFAELDELVEEHPAEDRQAEGDRHEPEQQHREGGQSGQEAVRPPRLEGADEVDEADDGQRQADEDHRDREDRLDRLRAGQQRGGEERREARQDPEGRPHDGAIGPEPPDARRVLPADSAGVRRLAGR